MTWGLCTEHPFVTAPDVTVGIYEDAKQQMHWRVSHESLYDQYMTSLLPVSNSFKCGDVQLQVHDTIDFSRLAQIRHLGGRGRSVVVRRSSCSESLEVFKGVNFGTLLESPSDFQHQMEACYHEIRTISLLQEHPHITAPPKTFVTVTRLGNDQRAFVCGALYPFMEHGTLDDQIQHMAAVEARLPLLEKAKWCFQMASAITHTNFIAHTFHMDIKPANFLLNTHKDLLLIDGEQSGVALYTLAPEADGSWDVKELVAGTSCPETADIHKPKLVYEKYSGPHRENLGWGRPK